MLVDILNLVSIYFKFIFQRLHIAFYYACSEIDIIYNSQVNTKNL